MDKEKTLRKLSGIDSERRGDKFLESWYPFLQVLNKTQLWELLPDNCPARRDNPTKQVAQRKLSTKAEIFSSVCQNILFTNCQKKETSDREFAELEEKLRKIEEGV